MKLLLALLASAASKSALAQAQAANDNILVLRRPVSEPVQITQAPTPSPTSAPAPTPTPTPAPAPTPTPTPVSGTWKDGEWSQWSNTCSLTASRTRSVTCISSSDPTVTLDASYCREAKPNEQEQSIVLTGCTSVDWHLGEWSPWTAQCGNAQHTRTVYCEALPPAGAGFTVDEAFNTKTKPATQESALQSNCSTTVENSDFETGAKTPWVGSGTAQYTVDGTTNWGTDGNYTGKLTQGQYLSNYIKDLVPGGRYRLTYMMRPTATIANSTLQVSAGNTTQQYPRTSSDVSWQPKTIDFVAFTSGNTPITFTANQGIFYFDKVLITPLP